MALGNNRPQILVQLEDCVLNAVISIAEGKSHENIIDDLYSQISSLEHDLMNDYDALAWFNIAPDPEAALDPEAAPDPVTDPSTPPPSSDASTGAIINLLCRLSEDLSFRKYIDDDAYSVLSTPRDSGSNSDLVTGSIA